MNLRTRFERFCLRNRDKGIPNLMLYICIGSAIVMIAGMINGGAVLGELLRFDKRLILQGQVWRLVTHIFSADAYSTPFLGLIFLYFFYRLGHSVEQSMGTLKFNLFYFGGILLMDIFAMIFCPTEDLIVGNYLVSAEIFSMFYNQMAYYMHLALILAFATSYPDAQFMILFIIPVRAWLMALIYLMLVAIDVVNMCVPVLLFPHCLFPIVSLLMYFLIFGKDVLNLVPYSMRVKLKRTAKPQQHKTEPIPFRPKPEPKDYTHRCTICGRTDKTAPELEFRYCSRCSGYHCYCSDHINNHEHIQ